MIQIVLTPDQIRLFSEATEMTVSQVSPQGHGGGVLDGFLR